FKVAAGFAAAVTGATLIALLFDHASFQHYLQFLRQAAIEREFIPTVSGVLRLFFFRDYFRMHFAPTGLGLLWTAWFCWRNRATWDWREHGLTVMVVAILTTPYGWLTDEVVLLPATVSAALAILAGQKKLPAGTRVALGVFALLNWILLMLLALHIPLQI